MKRLALLAFLVASCATTSTGPTPVTTFGHCTDDAVRKAGQGLLGQVMTALSTGDYTDALAQLGATFGAAEIGCAVDLAISELGNLHGAAPDEARVSLMLSRAQAWRGANP